jgi:hypothetical protein
MSLPVVLRAEAQTDFDEAFDWYEAQRPGLVHKPGDAVRFGSVV